MAKSISQTNKLSSSQGSEPKQLGQIIYDYALTSEEPLALLLRKCINCNGGDPCHSSPNTSLHDWLDNQQVMQTLNISERTLQNLRSQGTLPYSIFGGRCFYKRADLERLLQQGYRIEGKTTTYVEKGGWRDDD